MTKKSGSAGASKCGDEEWPKEKRVAILRGCRLFEAVPASVTAELGNCAAMRSWRRGQPLYKANDQIEFLHIIDKGLVRTYSKTESGREINLMISGPGDVLIIPTPGRRKYPATSEAMGDVRCLCVPAKPFLSCLDAQAGLTLAAIGLISDRLGEQVERNLFNSAESVETRIRHCLHLLSTRLGPLLAITCRELAGYADTTIETTIRVLGRLGQLGLVERKRDGLLVVGELVGGEKIPPPGARHHDREHALGEQEGTPTIVW
jgi:CRP/FNR family transcriptional regulator, nitrogen oxide reductase regulator